MKIFIVAAFAFVGLSAAKILAPLLSSEDAKVIPNSYIVVLKNNEMGALASHQAWLMEEIKNNKGSELVHTYEFDGLKGYSGTFSPELLNKIRESELVDYVEMDQEVGIVDRSFNLMPQLEQPREERDEFSLFDFLSKFQDFFNDKFDFQQSDVDSITQKKAPWGLSRVSHRKNPGKLSKYNYPSSAGEGVDVYVIDTGININHVDFEGRARWGKTIPMFDQDIDGNGHGTHCAGSIAGKTYGIAKKANVIAVKVLRTSGYGSNADVIKGVEWTANAHMENAKRGRKSVANMSLGGGRSIALETAVNNCVEKGVHFAVAAGNDNADACNYSPAGAEKPITVGASNKMDDMTYFSNHGPCVDIFAPGMDITSTWIGSNVATNTISGTSMASPHVAGVLALYLGEQDYTTSELKKLLISHASKGLLKKIPSQTRNLLLNINSLLESSQ